MSLPIMTSPEDVEGIISYLKTKVTGATITEAKATVDTKLIDSRKLSGYEAWGFIIRDGDKLKLSDTGREFARASNDKKVALYADALRKVKAYMTALEWIFHRKFDSVTNVEVASHWHQHCREEVGTDSEDTIRSQVVCFFYLATAAGLGATFLGRKGQATRLDISKEPLSLFISETAFDPHFHEKVETEEKDPNLFDTSDEDPVIEKKEEAVIPPTLPAIKPTDVARVFITHSKNMDIVEQIKTMLEVSNLDFEVAVEEETTAIPVPEKVLSAMRRCTAAVICVTADEQTLSEDGKYSINENVLIEIGAAFVLYDKRVILVWDKRLSVPSNLQGLYRCQFEGSEISWSTGMKLMQALKKFSST